VEGDQCVRRKSDLEKNSVMEKFLAFLSGLRKARWREGGKNVKVQGRRGEMGSRKHILEGAAEKVNKVGLLRGATHERQRRKIVKSRSMS